MSDSALRDLGQMLRHLEPALQPGEYVFCTVAADEVPAAWPDALASYREVEGLSLVLEQSAAENAGLAMSAPMRCISLTVHSSLEAVGLTAAVSAVLAEAGISANLIAAYHHDHVFVPAARAAEALALLKGLSED